MFRLSKKSGIFYQLGQDITLPQTLRFAKKKNPLLLESSKNRLLAIMFTFFFAFILIGARLLDVTILASSLEKTKNIIEEKTYALDIQMNRSEIVDRNGVTLAINLPSVHLSVNPKQVKNPETMAMALVQTLPDLNYKTLLESLNQKERSFLYIKRNLTPNEQYEVNRLGFPQLNFEKAQTRVYPQGELVSHIIGKSSIDCVGLAGLEKTFNDKLLEQKEPLHLSVDIGVQNSVRRILQESVAFYQAQGASAVLMNAKTAEIVSIVSLPDYNPNNLNEIEEKSLFNQASLGVYEVGSVMKLFSIAMGLDTKKITVKDTIDASKPLVLAGYKITDDKKLRRELSIPEILIHSSNIGAAKVALSVGTEKQRDYFQKFGFFKPSELELPEKARPLMPSQWREVNTATAGYGYGVALTPVHVAAGVAAIVNGGVYHPPTLIAKRSFDEIIGQRVISKKTSDVMRAIMRLVVAEGSGRRANVQGYEVGGKTGSAQRIVEGKYLKDSLRTSFVSAFPMDDPKFVLMVMLDDPKKIKETYYFNTAAWNAVPTAEKIIATVAPQLGIIPRPYEAKQVAPYVKVSLNAQ